MSKESLFLCIKTIAPAFSKKIFALLNIKKHADPKPKFASLPENEMVAPARPNMAHITD